MAKEGIIKYETFTVNTTTKTCTVDKRVPLSEMDKNLLSSYVAGGYVIKTKSIKKSNQAKERAEKQVSDKEILEALANNKDKLKEYEELKSKKGFFKARAWYKKNFLETEETKPEAKAK